MKAKLPQNNRLHGIYFRSGAGVLKARAGCSLMALLTGFLVLCVIPHVNAQTPGFNGHWKLNGNGNWSTAANWNNLDGGTDYPSGQDAFANLSTIDITANRTITLDVPVTLGELSIGDTTGNNSYTIQGGTLTFDSSGGVSTLTKTDGGNNDTISSAIVLNNELDIYNYDSSNSQGLLLTGVISGGTAGQVTLRFNDFSPTGVNGSLNFLYLSNGGNTFQGQLVVESGLLRYESNPRAAGAQGVGNETIATGGGGIDLRGLAFNYQSDDTEIFMIAGRGPNGLGALRNTTGTAFLSHLVVTDDAVLDSQGTMVLERRLNTAGNAGIASILDFGGKNLTKIGAGDFIVRGADVLNANGASLTINEGEMRFESRGLLNGTGASTGINLDGLTVNLAYNRNPYDNFDLANGSRTTNDLYGVNIYQTALQGNAVLDARFSVGSYWGASVGGTGSLAEQTKETLVFDGMTFNFNNGVFQREGNGEVGRTFDHIFTNVTINLVGGGIGPDDRGNGNLFDIGGGSASYNSTTGVFDNPGVEQFDGVFDNTSAGNAGTGFTVRGSREMRVTGNSVNFNGDILIKQPTGRWVSNSFDRSNGGQAASVIFNMSLAGADGSFSHANSITITRWGSLALLNNSASPLYASANNDDRINDFGFTNLRNGNLLLETDATVTNQENFGNVVADFGTNFLVLDTRAGGRFDGAFQSFTRNNGGVLKIYDANPAHTWGTGAGDDRIALVDATGLNTVGANAPGTTSQRIVVGLFGGVMPNLITPAFGSNTRPLSSTQGSYMYSGMGMNLMTYDNGYLRPLTAAEFDTSINPVSGTNWLVNRYIAPVTGVENYGDANNYAGRNVTADTAINSLTISFDAVASSQVIGTSTKDYIIIEQGKTLKINSGVININSFVQAANANMEGVIRGGFLDMNGQSTLINSNAGWNDTDRDSGNWYEFIVGNSSYIRSHIINTTDLVKTGRNTLYLDTWNTITGNIYLSDQGVLDVRHAGALGAGGAGREVLVGGNSALLLEYGTNITGINLRATNTYQGSTTLLRAEGATQSTWGGDIILDVADAAGSSEFQSYAVTARNNGTLSIYGNIYTANNQNFTDSDPYADPPVVTSNFGEAYTINLYGQYRDVATGNLGTDPANASITSIFRTGDSETRLDANHSLRFQMTGHDEGNVNVFQQWDATGRLDLNRGYFRILYDPNAAGNNGTGFLTDGADTLIQLNDYWTRLALGADGAGTNTYHTHLMLTRDGQVMNWSNQIYVYNNNRDGTISIGGENQSGTVYIGSSDGAASYSIYFENQGGDRDLRFLQTRGGTTVVNSRLFDNGTSVNSSATIIGPGTVIFNANTAGASTVERWNFMGGSAVWQGNAASGSLLGNDYFGIAAAQAIFGGGSLTYIGDTVASRTENLTGNFRILNGESGIHVISGAGFTATLNFGAAAASFSKSQGATLSFIETGAGTAAVTLQASGLTNTGLMSYATYGSALGVVTDFASNGASGAISAYAGYVSGAAESDFTAGNTVDVSSDVAFTGAAAPDNLRFNAPASLTLDGQSMTLGGGAILISSLNTGANTISGGTLTSGFDADLSGSGTSYDLMIHNYGTGTLTLGATITDNGGTQTNLVMGGTGTTILTAANTNTGEIYLNNGVLSISSESNLGAINGSVVKLVRVNNGGNGNSGLTSAYSANTNASIIFTTANAPITAAVGTFNSNTTVVTATSLISGGVGYTTGIWANLDDPNRTTENPAGVWAILNSGNLHFDGGTLAVTQDVTLDGARTLFLGANGGFLDVAAGKTLTINGYITSEYSQINSANGYTANQLGLVDDPASNGNPDIGDLTIRGGGTVVLTGAPDNIIRSNMMNTYGGLTWISEGTLKIAGAGTSATSALGTNRSWIDGTIVGANGTLEFATTSDPSIYEWITFGGTGYEGRGAVLTTGTGRVVRLNGQMQVDSPTLFNLASNTYGYVRLGEQGGALYGSGDILRTGANEFSFYVNAPDWTGRFLSGSGTSRVTGAGSLQGMLGMALDRNSFFLYSAGSTGIDEFRDRLNDNLVVTSNGYTRMRIENGAGVFSGQEKIGVVNVNSGVYGIEFALGGDVINGTIRLQGDYAAWHFTDIVRSQGSIVMVRNFDPGMDISSGVTDLTNRALVLVDNAPTLSGTGDGTNGNTAIIAGFFGGTRPALLNTTTGIAWDEDRTSRFLMTSVLSTDPITGAPVYYLRPLSDAPGSTDYKIISDAGTTTASAGPLDLTTAGISADQNVRFVGITDDAIGHGFTSRINSILTLDTVLETNSVTFATDATATNVNGAGNQVNLLMTQGGTLKINSGVLMFASMGTMDRLGAAFNADINLDINNYIIGGNLDFNGKEAIIYAGSEWAHYNTSDQLNAYRSTDGDNTTAIIRSSIYNTGGNGLTKTGASSVTLEAANYYTGDTTVTYGNLYARHDQALGQSTRLNITGGGNFILGYNSRITGVDVYVGQISGNNLVMYAEGDGAEWGGDIILDNVDSTGSAGGITRNFVARIEAASSNTVFHMNGNIYGGDTAVMSGAQATSRVFTTYTGASLSTLDFMGQIRDKANGAINLSAGDTLNDALRMEVAATTDTANVHLYQQYDAAGRISIVRGVLRYMGAGNFYTDAAALAQDPNSDLSGFQMGGRSLIDSNVGIGAADVSFFLHNSGTTFNLSSWNVGVDTSDPDNSLGNSNYGFGNTTGNTSLGGENISGTITFGTGTGSIRFTQADTLYDRNLNLYAARGGTVDMRVNFLDGGDLVNSSITKVGAGTVRLLGSSAGDSTVEALKMLGGTLMLTGYEVNAGRRVGNGAALTLSGGYLIVDATLGVAQEDFSNLTLNSGGSRLAVIGSATVNINSGITLNPASGVTMAFIESSGGVINISAPGLTTTDGARFGYWAVYGNALGQVTDWAAREGTSGVKAFTAYDVNDFTSGKNTEVTVSNTFSGPAVTNSVKFATNAYLDLGGSSLTVENGGILVSSSVGGAVDIFNGTLTRNGAGDILLYNYGAAITTISAAITNSGGGMVNLVTSGTGTTVLNATNTYTGDTYINGGTLQISSESALGSISGSVVRLVREYNGTNTGVNQSNASLYFLGGGSGSGAAGKYSSNSGQNVTSTTLTSGGSGYTSGIYVSTNAAGTNNAGIWAILDSGNLHIDGGTLATTDDINLNGARTVFIGASGATFNVAAGTALTVNGYIVSDVTDLPAGDAPIDLTRPLIGGLAVEGGGTLVLSGAPDNTLRENMYNGYNSLTLINNGTIKINGLASSASNALGTYSGWADSTYIGPNGTLLMNVTNADVGLYEWLTLDGQGYQGGGTFQTVTGNTGTTRAYYLRGQIHVLSDAVFNLRNGSNIYLNNGGGETYGSANIIKIGQGDFRFYSNESNFTGSFINASGSARVYDAGRIMSMASMVLERNSFFGLNNDSTSADETRSRLGDDMPVYTNGYVRMRFEGPAGVFSGIEKVGTANVLGGQLGIEFDMGATLAGGAPVLKGEYLGWHFTEIVRNPGTSVHLRLLDPGTSFADKNFNPAVPSNSNGNIAAVQVDVLPTLIGSGDGTNGNAAVAVGFFGGVRPNWYNVAGTGSLFNEDYIANRLVTVDTNSAGDHFLRPLLDSEYKVVGSPDDAQTTSIRLEDQGISADQNLKIVGVTSDSLGGSEFTSRQNSLLTLGSVAADCSLPSGINMIINSLTFASESFGAGTNGNGNWTALIIADGATLRINSGMIQMYNTGVQNMQGAAYNSGLNMDIRSSLNGGYTDFNGMDAQFNIGSLWVHYNTTDAINAYKATDFDNNYFSMNSSIINATGLVKSGGSSLFLNAVNYYTGLTTVSYGNLYARHDRALGASPQLQITGYGNFVLGLGSRISGVNLYIGAISGVNNALQIENNSVWAGDIIIDNVDSGGATAYARSFLPRIFSNTTGLASIDGNIYGGSTAIGSGARTDSRIFSTYTGALGLLYLNGVVQDNAAGAFTGPIDIYSQSQVLRMEVTANNDESAVQIGQQYNAAGRININRGTLYYSGNGDFYTAAAAATVNSAPLNPMIGLQMGGRSLTSDNGRGAANLAFFLLNAGSNFNLSSWQVGVDTNDPYNLAGNYVYGEGNTTGNTTLGGVNTTGTVTFGTGEGSVIFTQANAAYTRDLGLFAAKGGTVDLKVNFVDSGNLVTSSITKQGGGRVNLLGSTAGDSTVEGVNVMGGILALAGYDMNLNRRVGNGALLTLAGGTLVMDGTGASFTENFGSLKLNQGGNGIAAAGDGVANFGTISIAGTSINRAAASTIHFQSIAGGIINFSNAAMKGKARIGSFATYGANAAASGYATDWAATDAAGNVIAYTGYSTDSFGAGLQTDVLTAGLTAAATNSIRFNDAAGTITGGNLILNDGGLLFTSNYTTGTPIAAGVGVTTGGSGIDLLIHNYASGVVHFDGSITGAQNVVFTGTGEIAFTLPSSVSSIVVSSTMTTTTTTSAPITNPYTVKVSSTAGLSVGMDVSGMNIPAGTKIRSIVDGTTITLTRLVTGSGTFDLTYSSTTYTPANTYTGATHITGSAVVSFNNVGAFGATSGFFLNGGTLNYSEIGATSAAITQNITLGGNNGILSVSDAGSVLVIRGAVNQISSEASNIIAAYGTNNPNAGGLQIVGSGTVQFGDRSGFTNSTTEDLLGLVNNYTGLTILGDGVNALRVDIQGKGNNNAQYAPFGTTQSWADGTIIKNNVTVEFSMVRDANRTGQLRFREWFQIGEKAGDQILFDGSTQRQPTFDGILNIIGDLTFQTQGNRYGDAGSTGNSEFLINPNEGGIMGTGNIIKLGDGNLRFYTPMHEWTGDLDIQDGFVGLQMNSGAIFNPNGKIYFGDPTSGQTSAIQMRIENRYYGNNNIGIDAPNMDLTVNRDIVVRDNIRQLVSIAAGYLPTSGTIHFTNQINVGSGSSSYVRFYYEDGTNTPTSPYRTQLDPDLVGHVQETVFDISGSIIGSNRVVIDANNYGVYPAGAPIGDGALFILLLNGDNSGYSGIFSIGNDSSGTHTPGRDSILRIGSSTALGTAGQIDFRNGGTFQIGGNSMTFTQNFLFYGGAGMVTTAGIENASGTAAAITFDSGTQTGTNFQDIGVGLRDGVAPGLFGGGASALSVVKIGAGGTVFGASTGGGDVIDSFSSYTGTTQILEGTLFAGTNNSFSPYSRFIVSSGATLSPYWDYAGTGFLVTIGSLSGVDGSVTNIDQSTLNIGWDNTTDADFAGAIIGYGNLNKVGSGAQTLSGVNTFSGNVGVIQGTLIGTNNTAFGDAYNAINLGGLPIIGGTPLLDAKVELLLAGNATDVVNPVSMNYFSGNDEGITVIGTRETSGSYGFGLGGTVSLYQDQRTDDSYNLIPNSGTNVFFEARGASVFKFGDRVQNGGSDPVTNLVKIGTGTVELRASNSYGRIGSAGAAINGGTVIRHGTISIFDGYALSSTVVEMGDTRHELAGAYLATTSSLITRTSGSYDAAGNGAGGPGKGAFLNVNATVDGVAITAADIGKRILVKDESAHPEYNGVYQVVSVDASCGQMNLVRVSDFDEAGEMLYGSSIAVSHGTTQAGLQFFQASTDVASVNTARTDPVHWLQDVPNADVSLVAANGGMTIYNDIDINDTNGSGKTTLGGTFTSDTTYFYGNVTLQHSSLPGVDNVRELILLSSSNDDTLVTGEKGVVFSGVISEAQSGDTLSVNKQGSGTVTFTNDNTYTGKTTVSEGTLALAGGGAVSGTRWIEVNNGGTFDFSASTAGDFTFDGTFNGSGTVETGSGDLIIGTSGGAGVLRPGMSSDPFSIGTAGDGIGALTVNGNVVLTGSATGVDRLVLQMGGSNGADYNDAANITMQMGAGNLTAYLNSQGSFYDTQTGGNHDRLVVNGSFTLNSGGHITFSRGSTDYQPVVGDVFNLIDWSSVTANGFSAGGTTRGGGLLGDLALPDLSLSGLYYDTTLFASYGIVVVVPEPGRMALLLFGLAALLCGRRRSRR
ncbi:autotransporter-associated beta strand repeat-containing protein [Prosthecobacter fluviatilis]|uniref:Autotransporter-associated beta strand repeat-containing protein n=1 Tax=Prosthecobacter fluviatilis TaxID=445931 RepID=A0ABW0KPC2_9BACT